MKTASLLSLIALTAFSAVSAQAAQCNGYFSSVNAKKKTATYTITDAVPSRINPDEVTPVTNEAGEEIACDKALRNVIENGGIRIFNTDVTVVMKVFMHSEEFEILRPYLEEAKNPSNLKISYDWDLDSDSNEVLFVKVSK